MSDQQVDRLEAIRIGWLEAAGEPQTSQHGRDIEWLLRVVEAADEAVKTYEKADYKEASVDAALTAYQEVRRG